MISAVDALGLERAKLTAQEEIAAALLDFEIEKHVKATMEFNGCNGDKAFKTSETNGNVIAAVNQKLRRGGQWITNWSPIYEDRKLAGFQLQLTPTDAAYAEAEAQGKN